MPENFSLCFQNLSSYLRRCNLNVFWWKPRCFHENFLDNWVISKSENLEKLLKVSILKSLFVQAACFDGGDFKRGFNLQINFWSAAGAAPLEWWWKRNRLKNEKEGSWVFRKLSEKVKGSGAALLHKIRAKVNAANCTGMWSCSSFNREICFKKIRSKSFWRN